MFNLGMIKAENEQILHDGQYVFDKMTIPLTKSKRYSWITPKKANECVREKKYRSFLEPLLVKGSLITTIRRLSPAPLVVTNCDSDEINILLLRSNLVLPKEDAFDDEYLLSEDVEIFRSSVFTFLHHPEKVGVLTHRNGDILDILTTAAYFGYREIIFLGRNEFSWDEIKSAMITLKNEKICFGNVVLLMKEKEYIELSTKKSDVTEKPKKNFLIKNLIHRIHKKTPAQ